MIGTYYRNNQLQLSHNSISENAEIEAEGLSRSGPPPLGHELFTGNGFEDEESESLALATGKIGGAADQGQIQQGQGRVDRWGFPIPIPINTNTNQDSYGNVHVQSHSTLLLPSLNLDMR